MGEPVTFKRVCRSLLMFSSTFVIYFFFTILGQFRGKEIARIRDSAKRLNEGEVKKMDCGASSTRKRLPKANIDLHVVEAGDRDQGKMIILLHGFPDTWHGWHKIIPGLVKKGFFVVAPDMRGYNLSDKPVGVDQYAISHLTSDVKELIESYGKNQTVLLAHDWGGVVAWAFSLRYPEMLEKLIICNAPHPVLYNKELMSGGDQLWRSWYVFFFQLPILPEAGMKYYPKQTARTYFNQVPVTENDLDLSAAAYTQEGAPTAMMNYYRALGRSIFSRIMSKTKAKKEEAPAKSTVPTLVIWGEKDLALSKSGAMAGPFINDFRVRFFPNGSHWIIYEEADQIVEEVSKFALKAKL